jgi:CheY-like chemotaxis protein
MNIVIIDDEPVSLAVMKQLVAKLPDCCPRPFTTAAAALTWCKHNKPDLVLVDYMMPSMDGLEFTRRLKKQGCSTTPVVMVSAVVDRQIIQRALQNGVDDFLHKPFDFIELQTCVSEMLGLRAMQGQLANKRLLSIARELSAAAQSATPPTLLDRHLSRARLGGDEQLLGNIARVFIYSVPGVMCHLRASLVDSDFDAALAHIISLKGAVAAVEAPDVLKVLSQLEVHARSKNRVATVAAFAMMQALTERLFRELAPLVQAAPGRARHKEVVT